MEVHFYSGFKKRKNSTLRPSGDGQIIECTLKNGTSVVSPVLQVHISYQAAWNNYNYCYIPDFGRYYYIDDLTWENALASFSLSSDLLATFKSDIGVFSGLATRLSNNRNLFLPDGVVRKTDEISRKVLNLGISSPNPPPIDIPLMYPVVILNTSSIHYYLLTYASFQEIGRNITSWAGGAFDKQAGVLKTYAAKVAPSWLNASAAPGTITIGGTGNTFNISGVGCYELFPNCAHSTIAEWAGIIAEHPQISDYGSFLNDSNYRTLKIYSPLFGDVDLKLTAEMSGSLKIEADISTTTGDAIFYFFVGGTIAGAANASLFCDMPNFSNSVNVSGIASGLAGGVGGFAAAAAATNPATAVAAGIGAGASLVSSAFSGIPQRGVRGSAGSALSLGHKVIVVEEFALVRENDNAQQGRPFCGQYTASSGGYIEYERVNLNTTARGDEKTEIENAMERGFYYE